MITYAISTLIDRRDLSRAEAREVMGEIMRGEATPAQMGGFLAVLRAKGETADEIAGCAEAMREHVLQVHPTRTDLVDVVGTGGDGSRTFNISTAAAIVASAAGAAVAKHGNRSNTSRSGSADLLEALQVRIDLEPAAVARCIDEVGFGFMFAPRHHAAMKHVVPVRRELAVRTIFNFLGPLTNPAGATRQLLGVSDRRYQETIAEALLALGCDHALVVSSDDGLDEIGISGTTRVIEVAGGTTREEFVRAADLGLDDAPADAITGGSPEQNAAVVRAVLDGADRGPARDVILANAGAAILVAGGAADLATGVARAVEAIDSGAAAGVLSSLVTLTGQLASGGE